MLDCLELLAWGERFPMLRGLAGSVRRSYAVQLARRWHQDRAGVTSIEFGVVAMPFLLLLFGIISVCLYFFTNFTIENAVWQAARAIRTGQLQQSQGSYTGVTTTEDRKKAFKKALCDKAPTFLDCNNKAVVIVQSNTSFGGIVEPKCATNGLLANQATSGFDPGTASSVVLVTVCYPWTFGGKLPFLKIGNLSDGSVLMQASVAFRTEPYN
jgi:Flp pilus assembly protein TadG